jgi:3',5'-cyclic AMP phosphodiesterase CpdA
MKGMFTLAHISDIHLGPLPNLTLGELMSKRITGYVNWQRNRRKQLFGNTLELLLEDILTRAPDHMAVTGDLVNLATEIEVEAAAQWLANFPDAENVSVVPGNHDAYVRGAVDKVIHRWRHWMRGDDHRGEWLSHSQVFPYLRTRGKVALIGVSTATASPPFMASGYFSSRQARALATTLHQTGEAGLFRVVMIHHPPIRGAIANYKRMIGIRRFAAALHLSGAELVLHGHTHLNTLHWLNGRDGKVPVVGIASASQGNGGKKPPAAYNLFKISGERGAWSLQHQRYGLNPAGVGFSLDLDAVLINPKSA